MKKARVVTIVTVSLALVLISTVTYAAGKKKEVRPAAQTPEAKVEEEALKAELLAAMDEPRNEVPLPAVGRVKERSDSNEARPEDS